VLSAEVPAAIVTSGVVSPPVVGGTEASVLSTLVANPLVAACGAIVPGALAVVDATGSPVSGAIVLDAPLSGAAVVPGTAVVAATAVGNPVC